MPKEKRPHVEHRTLPLQLPVFNDEGGQEVQIVGNNFNYGKAGINALRGKITLGDSKIRKLNDKNIRHPAPRGKFQLYNKDNERGLAVRSYQTALNFTQALAHIIVRDEIDHSDLRNAYDTDTIKLESTQVHSQDKLTAITCVFSIKPKQIVLKNKEEDYQ